MTQFEKYSSLCDRAGMSSSKAANLAGFSSAAVSGWRRGSIISQKNQATLIAFFRAQGLEVADDYLVPDEETPKQVIAPTLRPILGAIPAGPCTYEDADVLGYAPTTADNPEDTFFLLVHGDSMIGAGIKPNDIVLIRHQDHAEDGQIVAVSMDGMQTLKRLRRDGRKIYLCPENDFYSRYELTTEDFDEGRARIIGVALEVTHKL